jgi:hypothetical protein
MNKTLFYFVAWVLIIISIRFLFVSAFANQPTEFLGALATVIVLATLVLSITEGRGVWEFLGLLFAVAFCGLIIGLINAIINTPLFVEADREQTLHTFVYATRWASLIWPIMVLLMGAKHYLAKEESAKTKVKNL